MKLPKILAKMKSRSNGEGRGIVKIICLSMMFLLLALKIEILVMGLIAGIYMWRKAI